MQQIQQIVDFRFFSIGSSGHGHGLQRLACRNPERDVDAHA